MRNPELERLEAKLALWNTPGFSQFINDLVEYSSAMLHIDTCVDALHNIYKKRAQELKNQQVGKFKQGKLDL